MHEDNGLATNSMMTRSTGAISMYPTGNLSGSVKFMSLTTGRLLTRDKWTVVPMPRDVIDTINRWAAKEKTPIPSEPLFQYRGKKVRVSKDITPIPEPAEHVMRDPVRVQSIIDPFEIDDSDSDSEPVGWMNTVPAVADERDSSDSEPVGEMGAVSVEAEVQNDGDPEPAGWMDAVPAGVED